MKNRLEYQKYVDLRDKYYNIISKIANVRIIVFIITIMSFIGKYYYFKFLLSIVFICSFILFLFLIFFHDKYYKIYFYYNQCCLVIETYLDRESGDWKKFEDNGSDFLKNGPYYYQDLDIFGDYSLFQFLTICKTKGGRERLRDRLSNVKFSSHQLKEEQEAITEISSNFNYVLDFSVLLSFYESKKVHLLEQFSLLKGRCSHAKRYFIASCICSFVCILLFVLALVGSVSIRYFYGMFLFNFMISVMYTYIFRDDFSIIDKFVNNCKGVNPIFKKVISWNFSSSKLKKIKKDMEEALDCSDYLNRVDSINSLRNNIISSFLFNGFFGINFILMYVFSCFLDKDLDVLKKGVSDVEKLEAMCSLANIGICFDNKCMPSLNDDVGISFSDMIHPLIGEKDCVPNSFNSRCGVNIITGSNMGGKTSFLRTVGMNMILMNSGTYVCAKEFEASYFKIFTSMRVIDDIENGISTFYGELLRIKDMVSYVDKGNMLVLIDEIFKGTNYQDRIYGAKEVIKRLNTDKTIVMLTTHDFELCEEDNVCNYHVKEAYEGDKIVFDYKIREGQCDSTNARYLMMKLGIIKK